MAPGVRLASCAVVFIAWWASPLVFGIKLVYLLKDPTVSVGMIGRLIEGAVNLARPIEYLSKLDGPSLFPLNGFFR